MKKEEAIQDAIWQERERILMAIDELEEQSRATRTPIYQDTMFSKIKELILIDNQPIALYNYRKLREAFHGC